MKKILTGLLAALALSGTATAQTDPQLPPMREHRAVWMSPMLGSWPGGAITESNLETRKKSLRTRLTALQNQGINVVYYHVRSFCDACYESSYEPWSSYVSSSRGVKPAGDPLQMIIETGHELGIEIYAWVNPLRYSHGGHWGAGERNYETSHPEWLLSSSSQIILNPAIPAVREQVKNICGEIARKYDIDGMIFDDYFYHSSITKSMDKSDYDAYVASLPEDVKAMSQDDWRRENINMVVGACQAAVKAERPYAVFSIGPAGRISPPNIGDYGLRPGPQGDMNWDGLFADPIGWESKGWLDFLSPQIYWPNWYDGLTDWYAEVARHFKRHNFNSIDLGRLTTLRSPEVIREIEYQRDALRVDEGGIVFFDLQQYVNFRDMYEGRSTPLGDILAATVFADDALVPVRYWDNAFQPQDMPAVTRSGNKLTWSVSSFPAGARFAVYGIPAGTDLKDFASQAQYLIGVTYAGEYTVKDAALKYGVAYYDRYGNLSAVRFEDSSLAEAANVACSYPVGVNPPALFDFKWNNGEGGRHVLEVAEDASFSNIIARKDVKGASVPSTDVADFESGKTYFWRLWTLAANRKAKVSEVASFVAEPIAIASPAEGAETTLTPAFTWQAAGEGTLYTIEIATSTTFSNIVYTASTNELSLAVPAKVLSSGKTYAARLRGERNGAKAVSEPRLFHTADVTSYTAPELLNPAADGVRIHSNQCVTVAEWDGMANVYVEIAATETFPARTTYKATLADFECETKPLGEVKISSKNLVDGKTYYVRVRGGYSLSTASTTQYTDYGPVRSFVYDANAGLTDVETAETYLRGTTLYQEAATAVTVYDLGGRAVMTAAAMTVDLSSLPAGAYIIRTATKTLKYIR